MPTKPVFLHQFLALAVYLLYQASAHRPDAADEEVQHLVFGKEEGVVNHVERLAQEAAVHDKGDVGFRGSLCAGYHVDAVTPQRAEQLAGNARRVFHVLAYDGHGGKVLFCLDGRYFPHFYLLGKFFRQYFARQVGVGVAHADGSGVFRRCLRYQEHADAVLSQCLEDAVVHADDAHHAQALHGDKAGVVDGRDALDGLALRVAHLLLDDGARARGVERVFYQYGYVFMAHRVDGGGIDHLGAEVAKFGGFHIAQLVDGIGGGYNARVGSHEAVHIRPDFQAVGIQRGGNDGGGVVRAAPSQVGHHPGALVRGNETGHQCKPWAVGKGFAHQPVGQFGVEHMLGVLLFGFDELARVQQFCAGQPCGNQRRQAFAVAHDGVRRLLRQVFYQVYALENVLQFVEQLAHLALQ